MGGEGVGFARGADALSRNLMGGINMGMQQQRYDQYDERYKDMAARQEKEFNRKMELERGRMGLGPSYLDAEGAIDPQEKANRDLQEHVMQNQDFSARPDPVIPSTENLSGQTQVGRLALPGQQMRHTSPVMPTAPAAPSPRFSRMPIPGRENMHTSPGFPDEGPGDNPGRRLFGGGSSVRRQPFMSRSQRPPYR